MTTDKLEPNGPRAGPGRSSLGPDINVDADAGSDTAIPAPASDAGAIPKPASAHPAGEIKHGRLMQIARGMLWATFFNTCCFVYVAPSGLGLRSDGCNCSSSPLVIVLRALLPSSPRRPVD